MTNNPDHLSNSICLESPFDLGVEIKGEDNIIATGHNCKLGARLFIQGNNNRVIIGNRCNLQSTFISIINVNNASISIGSHTTINEGGAIQVHECSQIEIGQDCMFSRHTFLTVSDMHPIYDAETGQRINPAAPVTIGNHVWLGLRAIIQKGATIGEGSIIGAGSVVTGTIPPNSLAAGVPARVLKNGVVWNRNFTDAPPAVRGSTVHS